MADGTMIEWTDASWSPITGCDRVSPGCDRCYALTMAKRLKAMGSPRYQTDGDPRTSGPGFGVALHDDVLTLPLRWRKPRRVFVNSMSDLFHPKVPDEFIARVFAVMAVTPQHTYQALTKRAARMRALLSSDGFERAVAAVLIDYRDHPGGAPWTVMKEVDSGLAHLERWPLPNLHLGVSVEDQERADARIPVLLDTPAAVRWLSCEPLLGPVDLSPWLPRPFERQQGGYEVHHGAGDRRWQHGLAIGWTVIGGESGPGARPMDLAWAQSLVDQCRAAGTPVFVKQLGSAWGREHHDINLFPEGLRVREYPNQAHA